MKEKKLLSKNYDPKLFEGKIYKKWVERGYFKAEIDKTKQPYAIVMPPPNVTGQLHMGHAINNTIQDIIIRFKRMQGFSALWLPGTDHASIATEAKIVEALAQEGITKQDIGREKFLEKAWDWKEHYGGRIVEQLKKLGSSCDWERERFTMDEGVTNAVQKVFLDMYKKGLIYRGERIINWCPKCKTSISDTEVEKIEKKGNMWYIRYPFKNDDGYVVVATTRPETMFGDTAVAVNPNDERYKNLIGKIVIVPLIEREIPVIADEYVEMEFGTGIVKITPAHDPNDLEVGLRHKLSPIKVMDNDAKMNELAGKYEGLDRYEARKAIILDLKKMGLIEKVVPHIHSIGQCYRCNTVVEPFVSKQWFVKMKPLAEPAIKIVKEKKIQFVPENFEKQYLHWMENIRDWCISRQLWWGHKIPAYYCDLCEHIEVATKKPTKCIKCGSTEFTEDNDTLDTWFSSALWPFATLGWPEKTEDLDYFYPTNTLVTGYDIIPFWVSKMIFSGLEHTNEAPFKYVLIHGIVRDEEGRKMSKSLGNGIDPLDVIEEYGADALRYALIIGTTLGNDLRFSYEKVEAGRNFCNKIWNATRFVLLNFDENFNPLDVDPSKFAIEDKWILTKLNRVIQEVTESLEKFDLGVALQKIYKFIWEDFCDWYIELVKPRLYFENDHSRQEAKYVLNFVLLNSMKLLHPYMPFITEEIFGHLYTDDESVMISRWPTSTPEYNFEKEESQMEIVMNVIKVIRNIRTEMNVSLSKKTSAVIITKKDEMIELLNKSAPLIEKLSSVEGLKVQDNKNGIVLNDCVSGLVEGAEIFIPLAELLDIQKEVERLLKEKERLLKEVEKAKSKLANKNFIEKAPIAIVEKEKEKAKKYSDMYDKVINRLQMLLRIEK